MVVGSTFMMAIGEVVSAIISHGGSIPANGSLINWGVEMGGTGKVARNGGSHMLCWQI